MSRRKIPWPGSPSIKQNFSLPSSIIYYMAMNPSSSEVYNKLIQSCKYFFEKSPILVVNRLEHFNDDEDKMNIYSKKRHPDDKRRVSTNLKKIASRFWLTGLLFIHENNIPNITSTLCSKLFRCDIISLALYDKTVMYDDFKLLINSVTHISLGDVIMLDNDGSVFNLEKIIESVSNVQEFTYIHNVGEQAIYKLGELSNLIKKHENLPILLYILEIHISDEYKTELDELIDTVIESGVPNRIIEYEGQDIEKFNILWNRYINKADVIIEDDDSSDSDDDETSDGESEDVSADDYEDE